MIIMRKIALSLLGLIVAFIVTLTIAYSFGLGNVIQNALMIANVVVLVLWLWFTWRGRWVWALAGIMLTFVLGVFVIPFVSTL
jgi:hypothetical protein